MENMDKGLNVPKWVLINRPKIPQMPEKFICPNCLPKNTKIPSPKVWYFAEKKTSLGVRSPWSESKFVPTTSRSFYMHSKSLYAVFCHLSYFSVTIYIFILYSKLAWLCSILAQICMSDDSDILFLFFP